jgi:hypothetical protein
MVQFTLKEFQKNNSYKVSGICELIVSTVKGIENSVSLITFLFFPFTRTHPRDSHAPTDTVSVSFLCHEGSYEHTKSTAHRAYRYSKCQIFLSRRFRIHTPSQQLTGPTDTVSVIFLCHEGSVYTHTHTPSQQLNDKFQAKLVPSQPSVVAVITNELAFCDS